MDDDGRLYLEDLRPGQRFTSATYELGADEIVAFASDYDPQPFHTDPEAAKGSIFGGLIASGWHSCAMGMRMLVDNVLSPDYSLGSPGVDEVRFLAPVRPGRPRPPLPAISRFRSQRSSTG